MKFYRLFVLSIFVLGSLFLSIPIFSQAATAASTSLKDTTVKVNPFEEKAKAGPSNGVVVANVNISNTKIISQKDNVFEVSFILSNSKGVQSGVKYGIQLLGTNIKDQFIADEKVYPESLTLSEGGKIPVGIIYEAPKTFTGTYKLFVMSRNETGLGLGRVLVSEVKLKSSSEGLEISPASCFLQVVGEKNSPHYNVLQKVDINKNEILSITCIVLNSTKKTLTVKPFIETHDKTSYGVIIPIISEPDQSITIKSEEKKIFSIILPVSDNPQIYSVNVKLISNEIVSNSVSATYIINGGGPTIYGLSLDKSYYKKGDTGILSLINILSKIDPLKGRIKTGGDLPSNFVIKATMVNDKNQECITPINQALIIGVENPKTDIPVMINKDCLNPKVEVILLDDKGNVLDQKNFLFSSESTPVTKKSSIIGIIFLIGILIVLGIAFYIRNLKKKQNA